MRVQIVTFSLKDISDADYRGVCDELADVVARMPGLVSKVWLADEAANTYGGVYTWVDPARHGGLPPERLLRRCRGEPELRECHVVRLRRPRGAEHHHPRTDHGRSVIDTRSRLGAWPRASVN